ncbi:TPA: hypothetical protein QII12_001212 [Klebsiella pneumoniae subsp. pneumoniae]|nr:hypothetical protein [Klebsiella pneumoniae]HDS8844109.1 hypothetical protein [Klebsiella pneumoniae subsp. pneumoniae]HDS9200872.1 hypothetical protein [Klebsiella pneumoniae]HDS9440945.1 hypothetical protein [Klebsiella pneumoniae subsp. pneumoniae]HDT0966932.1 hypothetical protein [Klebsiella pneumoniae subsp. pneumoniae]
MTKSTITREQRINEVKELIANAEEWAGYYEHPIHDKPQREMFEGMARVMAEHLAALTAMDSEPVAYIFKHPAGRLFWSLTDGSNKGHDDVMPVYASPQPAPIVEREPIAWLNDAYLARGVVDGEAGSEDAGPGYIPVYRHAQPAPVVSAELLHTAASAIEDLLTTKDRTGAFVWFDLPFRLRSAANAQPVTVVPDDVRQALSKMDDEIIAELDAEESACRAAMLAAAQQEEKGE